MCGAAPYCGPTWRPCQARRAVFPSYRQDAARHACGQPPRPSSRALRTAFVTGGRAGSAGAQKKWNLSRQAQLH
ncbi:hypothetical protein L493_0084 [Bordetella bronchiseptica 99-R-0433]|nr:hypothetical protein L493_0084 [Bordetella bronchiseptica 99-R-0433]